MKLKNICLTSPDVNTNRKAFWEQYGSGDVSNFNKWLREIPHKHKRMQSDSI